jgi:hypothetical protein
MGAFIGDRDFVGPKNGKAKRESIEYKIEMLLNKRKSGVITEPDKKQMNEMINM